MPNWTDWTRNIEIPIFAFHLKQEVVIQDKDGDLKDFVCKLLNKTVLFK